MRASSLAKDESVQRTCGWQRKVAEDMVEFLELALEEGSMSLTESRCKHILKPLESIDGERDGKDRGPFRLLKTVSTLLRLRGYKRGEPPFREIIIYGQPLLGSSPSPVRALEQAVHLCRSCAKLKCVQLINCQLDASEACVVEVIRLVKLLGQGGSGHFLQELNLSENSFDDAAAQRILEAALRDRCRNPPGNGAADGAAAPLWLDLSANCIKRPQNVFQKMEAWSAWAYREKSICLAKSSSCSKQECKHSALLHLPAFMEQEQKAAPLVLVENARNGSAKGKAATVRPSIRLRPGPGARRSRSRSAKSSGLSADDQESSEDEAEEEGEEEEEVEDDEIEGDVDLDRRKRRRTCSESDSGGSSEEVLSQAQVEERLDRLLNQLRNLHQDAATSQGTSGQPNEAVEEPTSLVEAGKVQRTSEDSKAIAEPQPVDQEVTIEGLEVPAEQEKKQTNHKDMSVEEQELPSGEMTMAEHEKLLADQQQAVEGLQMPAEHEDTQTNHKDIAAENEEPEMPCQHEISAEKEDTMAEHDKLSADQEMLADHQHGLQSMAANEIEIDASLAEVGEEEIHEKAPYQELKMMGMDGGPSQIAT